MDWPLLVVGGSGTAAVDPASGEGVEGAPDTDPEAGLPNQTDGAKAAIRAESPP
jgi:hypothetical protein